MHDPSREEAIGNRTVELVEIYGHPKGNYDLIRGHPICNESFVETFIVKQNNVTVFKGSYKQSLSFIRGKLNSCHCGGLLCYHYSRYDGMFWVSCNKCECNSKMHDEWENYSYEQLCKEGQ